MALSAFAVEVDGIAARVGSSVILKSDVIGEMRRAGVGPDRYAAVRGEMIERELMLKAAAKAKLQMQDWVVENRVREIVTCIFGGDMNRFKAALAKDRITFPEWRQRLKDDMVVAAIRWQMVDKTVTASPADMRKEYESHPERYVSDSRVTVSAILVGPGDAEKKPEIEEALKTEPFGEVAKKYSSDARAKDGGQWKDIKAALGQQAFDAEFYKIVKGYAAESDDIAAAFARRADMTITDAWHPEAYSPDYRDALRVIDKNLAGEAFTYGSKVANVAKYKCTHWLQLARNASSQAKAAQAAGKLVDAQGLAAASEAFAEESARQFTKQADRLIINKLAAMQAKGIKVPSGLNLDLFLEKVAVLKRSGMGRYGGTGLTSGEVDAVLKEGYKTGLDALYAELETLTVELDNAIKAAAK